MVNDLKYHPLLGDSEHFCLTFSVEYNQCNTLFSVEYNQCNTPFSVEYNQCNTPFSVEYNQCNTPFSPSRNVYKADYNKISEELQQ